MNSEGNNRVDHILKCGVLPSEALKHNVNGEDIKDIPATYTFLKSKTEEGLRKLWTDKWHGERWPDGKPIHRQMKHWLQEPNKVKSYYLVKLDRNMLGLCMQWLTGHTRMNRHQHLVNTCAKKNNADDGDKPIITAPTCRLCKRGDETPYNLVMDCDTMCDESNNSFGRQQTPPDPEKFQFN